MRRFSVALVVLAALAAGLYLQHRDTWAYRRSEDALYRNRAVLELHFREHGRYPSAASAFLGDLTDELNVSGRAIVAVDGWRQRLRYISSPDGLHYLLISPGENGEVEYRPGVAPPAERYVGQDVVIADGEFIYFWDGRTNCPATAKTTPTPYLECEARGGDRCIERLDRRCDEYDRDAGARTTTAPRRRLTSS